MTHSRFAAFMNGIRFVGIQKVNINVRCTSVDCAVYVDCRMENRDAKEKEKNRQLTNEIFLYELNIIEVTLLPYYYS